MWIRCLVTEQNRHWEWILQVIFKIPIFQSFDLGVLLAMQMICLACSGSAVGRLLGSSPFSVRLCNHGVFGNESLAHWYSVIVGFFLGVGFFFICFPFLLHQWCLNPNRYKTKPFLPFCFRKCSQICQCAPTDPTAYTEQLSRCQVSAGLGRGNI